MNIFFQIAIGLVPVFLTFLIITIVKRKAEKKDLILNIITVSVTGLILIAAVVMGIITALGKGNLSSEKKDKVTLDLVYAVAENGDYEYAFELLDSMRESSADSAAIAMCRGNLYASMRQPTYAKAMYSKANAMEEVKNYGQLMELCDRAIEESKVDYTTLIQNGEAEEIETECTDELKDYADDIIKESITDDDIKDTGDILAESEKVFDEFITSDTLPEDEIEKLINKLDKLIEENPELLEIPFVRECRLKLLSLVEKYKDIVATLDENTTFDELAIIAELYVNDLIKGKDFPEGYGENFTEIAEAVAKQLEKTKDIISDEEPNTQRRVEELIERLKDSSKNPAIAMLCEELAIIASDESSHDRPKAYMQLARIEYHEGNDELAEQYISSALNTVGVSDDDSFAVPMIEIVDAITDKDDINKVKDIAVYVEDVTSNSSDYLVVKAIDKAKQENGELTDTDTDTESGEARNPFEVFFADTASKKRNAFSITSVDATNFETVQLVVNVDPSISLTAEELKKLINIKDCGVDIEDFEIEKVEYSGAQIMLICDVSGSMSGDPTTDLKNAIKRFVETSNDIESISLVTFNSGIVDSYDFGTDTDTLINAADSIYSTGGTNMYGTIVDSMDGFDSDDNELRFILLLSDGCDGSPASIETINNEVGSYCKENGIVLYSLGLGNDVDIDYMNTIAASTGGYFTYVGDSATLESFYSTLRSQILNRYIITFEAKDTLRADRIVTISLNDKINNNIVSDSKKYTMYGTDADVDSLEENEDMIEFEGLSVSGLDTRRIFKNNNSVTVNLKGTGFKKDFTYSVNLKGKLDYDNITCEYVDENNIKLTLPGGMACGTYNLYVTINGKTAILMNELTVSAKGNEKTTTFGAYVFTSDTRAESENGITLSGYVTMNGWLHFNGDVTITGDLNSYSIQVNDESGSYIQYNKSTAEGLAKMFANKNFVLPIPALGTFNLYNDANESGNSVEYKVDYIPIPALYLVNTLSIHTPGVALYPDKLEVKGDAFNTELPMQKNLLKAVASDLFTFELGVSGYFTNKSIDVKIEASNKNTEDEGSTYKNRVPSNFGMMPIYTTPAEYDITINTLENQYIIDFAVKVAFIDSDGLGLYLEWGERDTDKGLQHLAPTKVMLKADFSIKSTLGTVPVTYSDFKLGLEDIDPNKSVLDWMLVGSFDLATTKVSDYIPGIAKWIDDPAILKLDDITARLRLNNFYIGAEAEAKLLENISLGKIELEFGNLTYTCMMLDLEDVQSKGARAKLTAGITWDTNNVDVELTGSLALNLHTAFFGIEAEGVCDIELSWWIFNKQFYQEGRALIGFMNVNNQKAFVVKSRSTNKDGTTEVYAYLYDGEKDCGKRKL